MNDQHELYESARRRIRQKKRLFIHFVIFVLGSLFFVTANKILRYGVSYDWYLAAILVWFFILILHSINVFITNPYFGKEWEREQTERLVEKHKLKLKKLKGKITEKLDSKTEDLKKRTI